MGIPEHTCILNESVRLNNSLHMISSLMKQRWPLRATFLDPEGTQRGKCFLDLKSNHWNLLEGLEQVLKPFECATVYLSGETYIIHSALPLLVKGRMYALLQLPLTKCFASR